MTPKMVQSVLLLGASGFVGRNLTNWLLDWGHNVTAVSQGQVVCERNNLTWISVDLRSQDALLALGIASYDVIIHAATVYPSKTRDIDGLYTVNTSSLLTILDEISRYSFCKSSNMPIVIFFSAMSMFRGIAEETINTNSIPCPRTPYDRSKWSSEIAIRGYTRGFVIRLPMVLEKGASRSWITDAFDRIRFQQDVVASNPDSAYNHITDYASVRSLLKFIIDNEHMVSGRRIFNLGAMHPITIREILQMMKDATKSRSRIIWDETGKALHRRPPVIDMNEQTFPEVKLSSARSIVVNYIRETMSLETDTTKF